jgi:hypothetical protein
LLAGKKLKMQINNIYQVTESDIDGQIAQLYSAFKFGSLPIITSCANKLTKLVANELGDGINDTLLAHVPTGLPYNALEYFTAAVARLTGRPLLNISRSKADVEYRNASVSERWARAPLLIEKLTETAHSGAHVLLLDDCTISGAFMSATSQMLVEHGFIPHCYVVLHVLSENSGTELLIESSWYRLHGASGLLDLLNKPSTAFVSHLIRFLFSLVESERNSILDGLSEGRRAEIGATARRMGSNTEFGRSEIAKL